VALLVALVKAGLPKRTIALLLAAFTCVGPLGACLGFRLAKGALGGVLEPLLVALTAGTFIYVGATEVVAEEFGSSGPHHDDGCDAGGGVGVTTRAASKAAKFTSFCGGLALIGAVIAVTERLEAAALAASF
jgi:zinc transporter 1/2/3